MAGTAVTRRRSEPAGAGGRPGGAPRGVAGRYSWSHFEPDSSSDEGEVVTGAVEVEIASGSPGPSPVPGPVPGRVTGPADNSMKEKVAAGPVPASPMAAARVEGSPRRRGSGGGEFLRGSREWQSRVGRALSRSAALGRSLEQFGAEAWGGGTPGVRSSLAALRHEGRLGLVSQGFSSRQRGEGLALALELDPDPAAGLKEQVHLYERELGDARRRAQELEDEALAQEAELQDARRRALALKEEALAQEAELRDARGRAQALEDEAAAREAELRRARAQAEEQQRQAQALRVELERRDASATSERDYRRRAEEAWAALQAYKSLCSQLGDRVRSLESRLGSQVAAACLECTTFYVPPHTS